MIDSNKFTDKYYPSANAARQNDVSRFIDSFNDLVGTTPIPEALRNKKLLCKSFYLQKTGNISRSHYQKVKEYLHNICDFAGVQGDLPTREEVINSGEVVSYFRSINSLLSFIENIGKDKIIDYNPTQDLIRVKSVCILGWIGLSPVEISDLKRGDLIPIGLNGYKIVTTTGEYEIFGEPFAVLYYLLDLEEYNGLPVGNSRGRKIVLKSNSDYLFKPQGADDDKLNEKQIVQIISRFNMSINKNTAIVFRNLYKNALFIEIYNDKSDKPLIAKIMDTIGCTYNVALSYREQYLQFANAMDNNKI